MSLVGKTRSNGVKEPLSTIKTEIKNKTNLSREKKTMVLFIATGLQKSPIVEVTPGKLRLACR